MKYAKNEFLGGNWVKGSQIQSGTRCRLTAETKPRESQWQNKDGSTKIQDVSRVKFEGFDEELNVNLNRPTLNALVDAFGDDSVNWQGKILTAVTEKVKVAGKTVFAVYFVPEGYEKIDDANGYTVIVKKGQQTGGQEEVVELPF